MSRVPYGLNVPKVEVVGIFVLDLLLVLSTCVDGPLWLVSLSSWAPEVGNQFLFVNPGSSRSIIHEVEMRCGGY